MFENKYFDLFVNLGSYKPKYILTRLTVTSISAIILIYIMGIMTGWETMAIGVRVSIYVMAIFAFNSISELNLLIIGLFKRWNKLLGNLYLQILCVMFTTLFVSLLWIKFAEQILGDHNLLNQRVTQIVLIIGLLVLLNHLLVVIISNLTKEWMNSRKEINELKQAKLVSDYNLLKDRLNPHFLFNNLSILKSLIHFSPQDAEIFTENFTSVYRYMLKCHEQKTVSLQEELKFLNAYVALHKERVGEGLIVDMAINESNLDKEIPPMTLQLLVENAIKHNITSKTKPLSIEVFTEENFVVVKNNLNPKEITYSTHTGLSTLKAQYKLLANRDIEIFSDGNSFLVKAPLL